MYRALKADTVPGRVFASATDPLTGLLHAERTHAFVKRLLQVTFHQWVASTNVAITKVAVHCPAPFAAGSLFLIAGTCTISERLSRPLILSQSEFAKVKKSLKKESQMILIFQIRDAWIV